MFHVKHQSVERITMTSRKNPGKHTAFFPSLPSVAGFAAVAGKKEGDGPLGKYFDEISSDPYFNQNTWEKAESEMQTRAFQIALNKAGLKANDIERLFAGDLLNQCISSSLSHREDSIPYVGLYGACSTMAESINLAAMTVDGGYAEIAGAITSSHFCSAERQYRMPLEYGGQRPPCAQWTTTASGCLILSKNGKGPVVCASVTGEIVDAGIKDANNMGAAMAPAAYSTLSALFAETGTSPQNYDLIVTGDLGKVGSGILRDLFAEDGLDLGDVYNDCGLMMFSPDQDTHSGGSGCGCSAAVLGGYILKMLEKGIYRRVIFAGTGALHSPTSVNQGDSIPGVCHACILADRKESAI